MANPNNRFPDSLSVTLAALAAACVMLSAGCREKNQPASPEAPAASPFPPEKTDDLRALIAAELAAGKKRIVIPEGRYRVEAERGGHLVFSGLTGVEIDARNAELVCTSTVRALLFEDCTDVILRGLTIDYDPLPFTQGKITGMAPDKSWIEFEIIGGYPDHALKGPFQIYDPAAKTLRRGDGRWNDEIKPLGNGRYRISKAPPYRYSKDEDTEQTGDILVCKNSFAKHGSPHAVELRDCKGVRLEDITLYAAFSFGFLERGCHGTTYLRCKVDRRSPENDPVRREFPRMRSLNADAYHSKDATKGPAILSCAARFMGDDAVNINGRFHYVRGGDGRGLRVAVIDNRTTIKPGDPVQFLPYSGPRPPDAKVVRRQPDPEPLSEEEKAFIRKLRMDEGMRADLLGDKAVFYTLTLDREISLAPGSVLCCPLRLGKGFAVKDCDFGDNRSRGILIKASDGEISGNRITDSRMHAVLISPEFWWMEAGMSSNVVVRDNHIKGCLETPIEIHALGGNRSILPAGALRDISILNNRIEDSAWPLIRVTSTTGLVIEGNILPSATQRSGAAGRQPILLENTETSRPPANAR